MKTMIRVLSLAMVLCMVVLAGCTPSVPTVPTTTAPINGSNPSSSATGDVPVVDQLKFAAGTILRMATGYNKIDTGLFFDDTVKGGVTLADGKTYNPGDLKPTWAEVENRLGMKFENKWQGSGSATKEFEYWQNSLDQVDMISGGAAILTENGDKLINLADYLDKMPNFKAYLDANPIVRLSVTGDVDNGAIYFAPYFDGVNDIERMPLMRTDWVVKLLDGAGAFKAENGSANLKASVYTPYMPTSGKVEVEVVKADGSAVEKINKDYEKAGNIVKKMNDALAAGTVTGEQAVNMLRTYIDEAYNGYYGEKRSDLFVGQNAAWDADELVALLRCVVANAKTLNGTDTIYGLFSREDSNLQRRVDMFRFAGTLFGVRGLESRQDYLYVGTDGKLHDARENPETYDALMRMNAMVQEGLISASFVAGNDDNAKTEAMLKNDLGFMHYDYNQTQTIYNQSALQEGEKYMAVMVPVARWNDGTEKYMRFTESWRSVKTDGWAISKAGVGNDQNKLYAALKLIDYAYSPEGQILMSYGPDAFIKMENGKYVTFNFNGTQMPVISDETYADLWRLEKGNYTNFARRYLGSTLSFVKSQAFEFQCTHEVGKEGAGNISNAIALGTIKHPELGIAENMWYTSVPTVLPLEERENTQINSYKELKDNFSTSKGKVNFLVNMIVKGYDAFEGANTSEAVAQMVSETWKCELALELRNDAFERLLEFYEDLNK